MQESSDVRRRAARGVAPELPALDRLDRKLLAALQAEGAATNAELAERVGLSQSQVSRRRARLEACGAIRGTHAELDAAALGYRLVAFIHVALAAHSRDNARRFRELVRLTPAVLEAHALTGEADYLLKIAARDLPDLASLVNDVLLPHESVERVRSEIVLETLKSFSGLPVEA